MPTYDEVVKKMVEQNILSSQDIFFYQKSDLVNIYDSIFSWCSDELILGNNIYKLSNANFFFKNDFSSNAFAFSHTNYQLIGIHIGLIEAMHHTFFHDINMYQEKEFEEYEKTFGLVPFNTASFLFMIFSRFIFFHELGHLLQSTKYPLRYFNEKLVDGENDITFKQQLREFDADYIASFQIVIQTLAFYRESLSNNKELGKDALRQCFAIGLAAMYVFFVKMSGYQPTIYFEGKSHPHPLVRLFYISEIVKNVVVANEGFKGTYFDNIFEEVRILAYRILRSNKDEIDNSEKIIIENVRGIIAYADRLHTNARKDNNLALNFFLSQNAKQKKS